MKTIEEIMGLVSKQVDLKAALYIAGSIGAAKVIGYAMNENMREIEAALRELVERKPLSDGVLDNAYLCNQEIKGELICFRAGARFAENSHKIGA